MRSVLLTVCLVLGALTAAQWWVWPVSSPVVGAGVDSGGTKTDTETSDALIPEYRLSPLDDYEEISQRPLFSDTRRPPEPALVAAEEPEPEPVKTPLPLHLKLTAIVMTPEGPLAMVNDLKSRATLSLKQGGDYGGWKIKSIQSDRMVVTQGSSRQQIPLRIFNVPPPPVAATSRAGSRQRTNRQVRRRPPRKAKVNTQRRGKG